MTSEKTEVLCKHCGQALSAFLREMEEHNAKVVCPSCGKEHRKEIPARKPAKATVTKH